MQARPDKNALSGTRIDSSTEILSGHRLIENLGLEDLATCAEATAVSYNQCRL